MVENVIIFAVIATALTSFLLSFIPAVWGKVFMFASAIVAMIPATMMLLETVNMEHIIWLTLGYVFILTGFINSLRFKPEITVM